MADEARLTPLPIEEWGEEAREVLPTYLRRPELYLSASPDAPPLPQALGLLARHLPLARPWLGFNEALAKQTALDVRLSELAILRVAWRTRCAYEWTQHTRIGQGAGLSVAQLYAIPDGPAAPLWTPIERAVLMATDELIDRHRVSDGTWAQLVEHLDSSEVLELLFFAGSYLCFALVCNSVGLAPDPPTEPIDAPELPGPEG